MKVDISKLNESQKKAVLHSGNALAIIAGAGSGKTSTLTKKVAYILSQGVHPSRVFVSAFTKASATEMIERLKDTIGKQAALKLRIGTFHSLCFRIYNDLHKAKRVGYRRPEILKGGGAFQMMKKIIKDHELTTKDIKGILNKISYWKNAGLSYEGAMDNYKDDLVPENKYCKVTPQNNALASHLFAYGEYEKWMKRNRKIDFDDMLLKTMFLLQDVKYKAEIKKLRRKIQYVLVDECQDTNYVQFKIIDLLLGGPENNTNFTMVGDDWQMIYGFRGSNIETLKAFITRYKCDTIVLEENYRSTKTIVGLGNKLIGHNKNQIDKTLFTNDIQGDVAKVMVSEDLDQEAENIVDQIAELIDRGFTFNDIGIVYRLNAQTRALVDHFVLNHIPHKVHSKFGFYHRSEVRDILSYIKILHNPFDGTKEDFARVINKPTRYLGAAAIETIDRFRLEEDYDCFWEALADSYKSGKFTGYQKQNLDNFIGDIENCNDMIMAADSSTCSIIEMIMKNIGYEKWLLKDGASAEDERENDNDKILNLDSLYDGAKRFPNPDDYFRYLASMEKMQSKQKDFINLMTIHKAKGLEFPIIFVVGMADKIYPFYRCIEESSEGYEDERRVTYVAITRAMEHLYLSTIRGKFGRFKVSPSPYIDEMGLSLPDVQRRSQKETETFLGGIAKSITGEENEKTSAG